VTIATLDDIITKVRKLTGTGNSLQLTDANLIDYINSFYLYDFPAELRTLQLENLVTLNTIENIDTYAFDYEHYTSLKAPAYINKRAVPFYQTPYPFYSSFFSEQDKISLDTGDGTTGAYSGTISAAPIIRSYNNNPEADTQTLPTSSFATGTYPPSFSEPNPSRVQNLLITANTATGTVNVTDDGNGNLIGDCSAGTIDYVTGAVSALEFTTAVPSGNTIYAWYRQANSGRPEAVLFWQNQLTLYPTPDQGYTVEIVAYRRPSQVLLGSELDTSGVPELLEWWETLAAGAAKKVFEDRQDLEGIQMMDKMLTERYALNETRAYAQLGTQRIGTIFSDQLERQNYGSINWGVENG
jgi:hypothetical protein